MPTDNTQLTLMTLGLVATLIRLGKTDEALESIEELRTYLRKQS